MAKLGDMYLGELMFARGEEMQDLVPLADPRPLRGRAYRLGLDRFDEIRNRLIDSGSIERMIVRLGHPHDDFRDFHLDRMWPTFEEKTLFAASLYKKIRTGSFGWDLATFVDLVNLYLDSRGAHERYGILAPTEMNVRIDMHMDDDEVPGGIAFSRGLPEGTTAHSRITREDLGSTSLIRMIRTYAKDNNITHIVTTDGSRKELARLRWFHKTRGRLPSAPEERYTLMFARANVDVFDLL